MPPASSSPPPRDLQALRSESALLVSWPDRQDRLPFHYLRTECGCAQCVNEWTGQRMLDPASIAADVAIVRMELVGNYAVRIQWSDGHSSGLYTWQRLRRVGDDRA